MASHHQGSKLVYTDLVAAMGELKAVQLLNALEASCFAEAVQMHRERSKQLRLDIVINHIYRVAEDDSADIFQAVLRA